MSVLPIYVWPEPHLSQESAFVPLDMELEELVADMFQTTYAANGRSLAAPQIGQSLKLSVCDLTWKDGSVSPEIFVNAEMVDHSDETIKSVESSLSIPGIEFQLDRFHTVRMKYRDISGNAIVRDFQGLDAIVVQQELDYIKGILPWDHLSPSEKRAKVSEFKNIERP